ncbi:MAG: 3-dehydroquinate synthase [Ruminococcaceae bacterium]|nr:3-dehydroquinate synthase [Oscillospiraceae bacterium]
MKKIHVAAEKPYDVLLEAGSFGAAGKYIQPYCKNGYAAIVTDDTVDGFYGGMLEEALSREGIRTVKFVIPHGESSKNAETYVTLLEFLAENRLTRQDLMIALGGGVVGDLAGFAAATFLRGIPYMQIPTTLLAMVDSSVGGKTAIDLRAGKNLAGAFYQPAAVICDPDLLHTLPEAYQADGVAEVIKYGVLGSASLFTHLQEKGTAFDRTAVIGECIAMKSDIVQRDERDIGVRQLLNFGHTIGHAIEKNSRYAVSHGRAVAIGMVLMAKSAARAGLCGEEVATEIAEVCRIFGLPTATEYTAESLYDAMLSDKKRTGDTVTLVVPETIGKCRLHPISVPGLLPFLKQGME